MRLQTTKKVRATMYIEHHPPTVCIRLLPRFIITLHLNPFALQISLVTTPLPPRLPSNAFDTSLTQLRIYMVCGFG